MKIFNAKKLIFILLPFFLISQCFASVVTSIKPLGFIASAIADKVDDVIVVVPDGGSPHQYTLKPANVLDVKQADLLVWVGPELEGFMDGVITKTKNKNVIEIANLEKVKPLLIKGVPHTHGEDDHDAHDCNHADHKHGEYDMHVWLSPEIANQTAIAIHEKLLLIYPDKEQELSQNLSNFQLNLQQTVKTIANRLNKVENKGYFVFHPAYGYFESDFNLKNQGSITFNPSVQPGVKTVLNIQQQLKENQATCIFSEPQFNDRMINKIVENSEVKIGKLDPLGISVPVSKNGYFDFLLNLTSQFEHCLQ